VAVLRFGKWQQFASPNELYDRPANAFVMDFLGNVNVFHGRVEGGKALVPGLELAYPEYPHAEAQPAAVYVRPHEIDIQHHRNGDASSLHARVVHVNPAGPKTKVELRAVDFDLAIKAEISAERLQELGLKPGDTVHVVPRRMRVFVPGVAQ